MNEIIWAAYELDHSSYFSIRVEGRSYSASIRVRRESKDTIDRLHKVLGGNVGRGKDYYWLNITNQRCTEVLMKLLPYMTKKIAQAQAIMEFNMHLKERKPGRITDEEVKIREAYRIKLKLSIQ